MPVESPKAIQPDLVWKVPIICTRGSTTPQRLLSDQETYHAPTLYSVPLTLQANLASRSPWKSVVSVCPSGVPGPQGSKILLHD